MNALDTRAVFVFRFTALLFVFGFLSALPFAARAEEVAPDDPPLPPPSAAFATFLLNGEAADTALSSTTPDVEIIVNAAEEAYFTRLYICAVTAEPCNQGTAAKWFAVNATTTSFSKTWDGRVSSNVPAGTGEYTVVARYYRYDIQPEAFEENSPYSISVSPVPAGGLGGGGNENGGDDTTNNGGGTMEDATAFEFSLNGVATSTMLSSTTPAALITATSSHPVYVTRLYLCAQSVINAGDCNQSQAVKWFSVNATTTNFSKVWDGSVSGGAQAGPGMYVPVVRYFDYGRQGSAIQEAASFHITVPAPPPVVHISGVVQEDMHWKPEHGVYVVENAIFHGATVTVAPGTIIKLSGERPLRVQNGGSLIMNGSTSTPIIVTSIKDDSAGGDTNGDGDATVPAVGDWYEIIINDGTDVEFEHVTFRYGGSSIYCAFGACAQRPALMVNDGVVAFRSIAVATSTNSGFVHLFNGSLAVSDSTFSGGDVGIVASGGALSVANTTFSNLTHGFRADGASVTFSGNILDNANLFIAHPSLVTNAGNNSGTGLIVLTGRFDDGASYRIIRDGLPYRPINVVIRDNSELVVEAGVIFKGFSDQEYHTLFSVEGGGKLTVGDASADARPVVFTSLRDDTVLGDSNGDGDATVPAPGDITYGIRVNTGGTVALNTIVASYTSRYFSCAFGFCNHHAFLLNNGGIATIKDASFSNFKNSGALVQASGTTTVSRAQFSKGSPGVRMFGGVFFISESSFPETVASGINNDSGTIVNAVRNWWGSVSGPTHPNNPDGAGAAAVGFIDFSSWLLANPFAPPPPPTLDPEPEPEENDDPKPPPDLAACCSSVLFLPGLQGSILKSGDNTLWPPTYGDVNGDLGKLAFEEGIPVTENIIVDGIVNNSYNTPIYRGFSEFMDRLTAIDSETGTSTIHAWEPFAYDWRYLPDDIVTMGANTPIGNENLLDVLEALAESSHTGRVTVIAHSYGGLVGKALIKALEEKGETDLIDNYIMVGSPQLGTPQAVAGLLHGEGSDLGNDFNFLGWMPFKLVTKKQARTLGDALPSPYALLPSSKYLGRVNEKIITFNKGGPKSDEWRSVYGTEGITAYNDLVSFLTAEFVPRPGGINGMPTVLDSSRIISGKQTHELYDSFEFPETMRVVQIAGWGLPTIKGIKYSGGIAKTTYEVDLTTEGDGTVVYPSAVATSDAEKYFLNLEIYNINPLFDDYNHLNLLSFPPIQDFLQSVFRNISVTTSIFVTETKPKEENIADRLIVSAHSPVTLGVTDQFGNYTGITPGRDPDADILTIETGIPGSSYFTVGDTKYIILPDDGVYTFTMGGTGEGEVTVVIETLSNGDNQNTVATYSDFQVSTTTQASFSITSGTPGGITLDQDGNGTVDETVFSNEALAEQTTQTVPSAGSTGGGGPLWVSPPIVSTAEPSVDGPIIPSTTTAVVIEEAPLNNTVESTVLSSPEPKRSVTQVTQPSDEISASTPTLQQAAAIESWWYDKLIDFIKQKIHSLTALFRSFF